MKSFTSMAAAWLLAGASVIAARADITNTFSTNPLTDPSVIIQGPDAPNAASRFTYNAAAGTLTAHYDTLQPTIQLVIPLGQHLTQNNSFSVSTRIEIQSSGLIIPSDFGGEVPSFGLISSTATGSTRASTGFFDSDFNFHEVTAGTAYDQLSWDYFPTTDPTFGGSDVSLTNILPAQSGVTFDNSFGPGPFGEVNLPLDQFFTAGFSYDAGTQTATLNWGSGFVSGSLAGAAFDVDSFAITLWNDPNVTAQAPAMPAGHQAVANVVFDSLIVQTPEPASVAMLAALPLLMVRRRHRGTR